MHQNNTTMHQKGFISKKKDTKKAELGQNLSVSPTIIICILSDYQHRVNPNQTSGL